MEPDIIRILATLRPEHDFTGSQDFVADGLIDSFDLLVLVVELEKAFGVKIKGEDILPEHFVSAASIAALVKKSGGH